MSDPQRNVRCIICLGRFKNFKKEMTECKRCGRVYHKTCAKRIVACVMCGSDL